MLIGIGIFFTTIVFGQTKTDAELFATWKDKSKPETVRLEAIWERIDIDSIAQSGTRMVEEMEK